jgi:predicted lipoprotein with Yx(FWY)xxD motif
MHDRAITRRALFIRERGTVANPERPCMNDRLPPMRTLAVALCATLALAACKRGSGDDDTLATGATDAPSASSDASNVGPSSPPVNAAGPAVGDQASQPMGNTSATPTGATLMLVSQGPHAPYLSNAAGNALYYVEGDTDGSKCTGPCTQSWPPVTIESQQPTGAPGLQGAMIATITRQDGSRQVTFGGHPLYRYAADAGAGSANGDGVKDKFGTWHLATAGDAQPAVPKTGG